MDSQNLMMFFYLKIEMNIGMFEMNMKMKNGRSPVTFATVSIEGTTSRLKRYLCLDDDCQNLQATAQVPNR